MRNRHVISMFARVVWCVHADCKSLTAYRWCVFVCVCVRCVGCFLLQIGSPLHVCMQRNHAHVARRLLEADSTDLNVRFLTCILCIA
jgi:hypothetical protein